MQRLAWRTDSCLDCVGPQGEDLSGGFYEAGGSYLKFSFPTAYTFTQLAWGIIEFRDGYVKVLPSFWLSAGSDAPLSAEPRFISQLQELKLPCLKSVCHVQSGELDQALETLKWGMDYLVNCHSAPNQFVAMLGASEVSWPCAAARALQMLHTPSPAAALS